MSYEVTAVLAYGFPLPEGFARDLRDRDGHVEIIGVGDCHGGTTALVVVKDSVRRAGYEPKAIITNRDVHEVLWHVCLANFVIDHRIPWPDSGPTWLLAADKT